MSNEHQDLHGDLAAGVAAYAERSGGLSRVRRLRDAAQGFDAAGWRQAGEFGWLGLRVPDSVGGSGLGLAELAVVMRAAGRALLPEPLAAGAALAACVLARSVEARGRSVLGAFLRGEAYAGVAWQETLGDLATDAVETASSAGRVTGTKAFVVFGAAAAGWLVSARDARGVGVYWIDAGTRDAVYTSHRRADGSEQGTLRLDGVEVGSASIVVPHGEGERVLAQAVDECIVAQAAELLGVGERALEITLDHLRTREQFGKPIGSFQALQHRCVDLFIRKELGAAALAAVLTEWPDASPVRRSALASRVKARCADAALEICRQAVQMHGAMGFTDECDVGLYLKRALVTSAWLGNAQVHRRRYARLAFAQPARSNRVEDA